MTKHFQECNNILQVSSFYFFFPQGSGHPPCSKKKKKKIECEKEKNPAPIAGLLTEMLIDVCCSHVTAQRTSLLIGSITLTPDNNINVNFMFSTIQKLMQIVSAKIIPLVISSLNFLTVSAMRIIILQLCEEKKEQSRNMSQKPNHWH